MNLSAMRTTLEESALAYCRTLETFLEHAQQAATQHARQTIPALESCRIAVLALGWLGGEEIPSTEDVVLLYTYDAHEQVEAWRNFDWQTWETVFVEHASAAAKEAGMALQVRFRHRARAWSTEYNSFLCWYDNQEALEERASLLQARPVAGDHQLGEKFLQDVSSYVYRSAMHPRELEEFVLGTAEEVQETQAHLRMLVRTVQSLQLLYAGRDVTLRERNTLRAIDKLMYAGRLRAREHQQLCTAYLVFQQKESSPKDVQQYQEEVSRIVETLWGKFSATSLGTRQECRHWLGQQGYLERDASARACFALLALLLRVTSRSQETLGMFVASAAQSPLPDLALQQLVRFLQRPEAKLYVSHLREKPRLLSLLLSAFSCEFAAVRSLFEAPHLLEALFWSRHAALVQRAEAFREVLFESLVNKKDRNECRLVVYQFQQEETLRVMLHEVAGTITQEERQEALSTLAAVLLETGLAIAQQEDLAAHPREPSLGLAVIAMGKLGSRELSYQSDLDLVFVSSGDDEARCTRVAQQTISWLQGAQRETRLYAVDTRLRPSGRQGPLVVSERAFARYYGLGSDSLRRGAQLWEELALLRARPVAGDRALCARLKALRAQVLAIPRTHPEVSAEVQRIRMRQMQELTKPDRFHLKVSAGGLLDLELLVQALLRVTPSLSSIAAMSICEASQHLVTVGQLSQEQCNVLQETYRFLSSVVSYNRLLLAQADDELPSTAEKLHGLAKLLHLETSEALTACVQKARQSVQTLLAAKL